MKDVFRGTFSAALGAVADFFSSDIDVISNDAKRILADEDDAKVYLKALDELRKAEADGEENPRVKITLKDNKELILGR